MRRMQVPLYMTSGMATKAAALYATLTEWCSQGLQLTAATARTNPFAAPRFQVLHSPQACHVRWRLLVHRSHFHLATAIMTTLIRPQGKGASVASTCCFWCTLQLQLPP